MIEDAKENLMPWRDSITYAAREARGPDSSGYEQCAVAVNLVFWFPRPKSHYRANGGLKETAPGMKASRPDIDKLSRAVLDAITASGVWRDDAQVAELHTTKRYAYVGEDPGLAVAIRGLA